MSTRAGTDYAAALLRAGFVRHGVARPGPQGAEVYRRAAPGSWSLEARPHGSAVDVGLTLEPPGAGALIGPVHRALSPAALSAALPEIVASLEALAGTSQMLRCPGCNSWVVMQDGRSGPFLSCAGTRRRRRPFADRHRVEKCRGNLAMPALLIHGDPAS